ncbi:MAG TPA: acyltransferase [Burkholderiaceae bacterium]|nr:acyltransferase [Burkholderiaceae bacterium]
MPTSSADVQHARLGNLQVLRGLAALAVVLFHVLETSVHQQRPVALLVPLAGWGAWGVDLFFVLSGFVMVHTQQRRPRSAGRFLADRLWRIVPLYWLLTLTVVLLQLLRPGLFHGALADGRQLLASLGFVSGAWLGRPPVLWLGWTLEWEMAFYLLFTLGLLLPWRAGPALCVSLGLALLIALGADALGLEFLLGMGLAALHRRLPGHRPWAPWLVALGALGLLASLGQPAPAQRLLHWGLPAALLLLGALGLRQTRWAPGQWLGDASYSIYLVQALSIPALYRLLRLWPGLQADGVALLVIAGTALAGLACHRWLERPLLRLRRGAPLNPPRP